MTVHTTVFLVANGCMFLIYAARSPFFERFKIQNTPWPWLRGQAERDSYKLLIKKTLALISFNLFGLQPLLLWFGYPDQKKLGMSGDLATLPAW
jgi:hypothetical protein